MSTAADYRRIAQLAETLVELRKTELLRCTYANEAQPGFPYKFQREFHNAGKTHAQRALLAFLAEESG